MSDQQQYHASTLFPRGVADEEKQIACLSLGDGMCAVSLRDGALLWQSTAAQQPLLIRGDQVIAVAARGLNSANVVVLELSNGKPSGPSASIEFPVGVDVHDRSGFACRALEHEGDLLLSWRAERRYRGGAPPSPEIQKQYAGEVSGVVRVRLRDGSIENVPPDSVPSELSSRLESADVPEAPPAAKETRSLGGRIYYVDREDESRLVAYDPDKAEAEWVRELPSLRADTTPPKLRP